MIALILSAGCMWGQTQRVVSAIYIKAYLGEAEATPGLWEGSRYHGELLDFDVVYVDTVVEIFWTTAVEVGSKYFAIERQQYDGSFAIIQIVGAKGMSEKLTTYSTQDVKPFPGFNIYRIRQINQDGEENIGPIRRLEVIEGAWVTIAPKVSEDKIDFTGQEDVMMVQVVNRDGQVVLKQSRSANWREVWDIGQLQAGQYALRIHRKNGIEVLRFNKTAP